MQTVRAVTGTKCFNQVAHLTFVCLLYVQSISSLSFLHLRQPVPFLDRSSYPKIPPLIWSQNLFPCIQSITDSNSIPWVSTEQAAFHFHMSALPEFEESDVVELVRAQTQGPGSLLLPSLTVCV